MYRTEITAGTDGLCFVRQWFNPINGRWFTFAHFYKQTLRTLPLMWRIV